jgi:hypothetical protein
MSLMMTDANEKHPPPQALEQPVRQSANSYPGQIRKGYCQIRLQESQIPLPISDRCEIQDRFFPGHFECGDSQDI